MSHYNHRRPLQRQTSLRSELLSTPPSNRAPPIIRNVSANPKSLLTKTGKAPLIGILRNKQRSEEIPDHQLKPSPQTDDKRATSALGHNIKVLPKNRPGNVVKVAWADDTSGPNDGILTRKEAVLNKVAPGKFGAYFGAVGNKFAAASEREQELVLCSREQLAQRLRSAWQDRESSKKNLSIVLTPQIKAEESLEEQDIPPANEDSPFLPPKSVQENESSSIVDVTNIFHRTIPRRSLLLKLDQQSQISYEPTKNIGNIPTRRTSTLVIPIIEKQLYVGKETTTTTHDNNKSINSVVQSQLVKEDNNQKVIIVTEANQKRELFQSKKSPFDSTVDINVSPKPKLVRARSVPSKYTLLEKSLTEKSKIPKRRRIRSSTTFAARKTSEALFRSSEQHYAAGNQPSRQVYQHSKDIVTMVSLLSPNNTDNEDEVDGGDARQTLIEDNKDKRAAMDRDDVHQEKSAKLQQQQHGFTSLRKTVKSVSFQQSSIYSVRSFCVSFPGRRGSVGATGTISGLSHIKKPPNNSQGNTTATSTVQSATNGANKLQEKRGSFSEENEDLAGKPKRRLVRTVSESNDACYTSDMSIHSSVGQSTSQVSPPVDSSDSTADVSGQTSVEVVQTTVSDKEVYCMNTHRKLTESGINISLETILRGMLTPTEYRLRCKREEAAKQPEDNIKLCT